MPSHPVAVLRMPVNRVRCQTILPTIVAMSAAEKARNDSVRILPSAPRLKLSDMAEDSSGASTIVTVSYRPCVQKMSFTVTPNVFASCLKASARFGESYLDIRIERANSTPAGL